MRSRLSQKAIFILALCFYVFFSFSPQSAWAKGNPRYASIVMDADTGVILSQRYADKRLHPASLVKMMTLMMTFEALDNGTLSLRDRVGISRHAASMVPSKLDLPVGSSIRVEDAIYALVTKSANDVAVALAEKIGGTESRFASKMNQRAREIGMENTYFVNASGLHHTRQVTTARDMARLSQYIIRHYPRYYSYFSTREFTYRGKSYRNHNRLMEKYRGMDGLKTGYISASGFNLAASAKRNNRRVIGVVFGGRTANSRNAHMKMILDQGFAKLNQILVSQNAPLPEHKPQNPKLLANVASTGGVGTINHWAELKPMLQDKNFRKLIGEGDFDPAETKRFETGLLAIAAIKGNLPAAPPQTVTYSAPTETKGWSIQVGAYGSRAKTDFIIKEAQELLGPDIAQASPIIVPLKTKQGWIFRGRLSGFSKKEALHACQRLKECLPISPQAH